MILIILIAIASMLFGGFLLLTAFEQGRGMRIAGSVRNSLDAKVARVSFVIAHVDWMAFAKHLVVSATSNMAHDAAHAVLMLVRYLERLLTRAVKSLRERRHHADAADDTSSVLERALVRVRLALRHARAAGRKGMPRKRSQKAAGEADLG